MKNIVHTLTLAQMRANPRRTLVTLVGVVLSVTIVLAVVLVMGVCWISGLLTRRSLEEQTITEAIQKKLF